VHRIELRFLAAANLVVGKLGEGDDDDDDDDNSGDGEL